MTNIEVGRRLTQTILDDPRGAAIAARYAADATIVSPAESFQGRERIAAFFDEWFQSFTVLNVNDTTMLEDGRMLLVEAVSTLRHLDSGQEVVVLAMESLEIDDDLVQAHRFYYDRQAIAEQLAAQAATGAITS